MAKSLYYRIEFLVVVGVSQLGILQFLTEVGDRVALLVQNAAYTKLESITCYFERFRKIL